MVDEFGVRWGLWCLPRVCWTFDCLLWFMWLVRGRFLVLPWSLVVICGEVFVLCFVVLYIDLWICLSGVVSGWFDVSCSSGWARLAVAGVSCLSRIVSGFAWFARI